MRSEPIGIAPLLSLEEGHPQRAEVEGVPLVLVRMGADVHVLYGRCPHRSADLACATVEGPELVCHEHGWAFQYATGVSSGLPGVSLHRFDAWVEPSRGEVMVDAAEVRAFREAHVDAFAYDL